MIIDSFRKWIRLSVGTNKFPKMLDIISDQMDVQNEKISRPKNTAQMSSSDLNIALVPEKGVC